MTITGANNVTAAEANKQTIRNLFRAVNEHRIGDLPDYIAADVIDHNKIIHGEADEPGAAFDGFARQLAAFGDIAMAPQELIAEGDQVAVRFVASGTHTGFIPNASADRPALRSRADLDLHPRPRQGHRDPRRQRPPGPVRPAGLGLAVIGGEAEAARSQEGT